MNLFRPIFFRRFILVQTLKVSVMPFIQRFRLLHGDSPVAGGFEDEGEGFLGAKKVRGEGAGDGVARNLPPGDPGLLLPPWSEVDVHPSCKAVFLVPDAFPMPDQNKKCFLSQEEPPAMR